MLRSILRLTPQDDSEKVFSPEAHLDAASRTKIVKRAKKQDFASRSRFIMNNPG